MSDEKLAAKDLYELRFKEGLSWSQVREKSGRKLRSTQFLAQMVPYAKDKRIISKHLPDGAQPSEALVKAVERASAEK